VRGTEADLLTEGVEVSLIEIGKVEHCMGKVEPWIKKILNCKRRAEEISAIGLPLANWVQLLQLAVLLIQAGHACQPLSHDHHAAWKLHSGILGALSSLNWGVELCRVSGV